MIRIAVQKSGRLSDESIMLLKKSGFSFSQSDRALSIRAENFPLEILFLRAQDIPEMIFDGVIDLGIFGENTIAESRFSADLIILKKLGFGKCSLVLAAPENSKIKKLADFAGAKIATSHPGLLKDFFLEKKISAEIIPMSGSVEIAPAIKISDGICDLVSSGATFAAHGIVPVYEIFSSEAVLVSSKNFAPNRKRDSGKVFDEFVMRIDSVLRAKNLKSVLMNAPKSALKSIEEILPGLDSPTVMPLARENWVAIHSVVAEDSNFWTKISALKSAGASGILISPIDRVIF